MGKWYKLDNAAKIFPPSTSRLDSKIFRVSCSLRNLVDKDILQSALDKTLKSIPMFNSVMKKGLFWYYLETSNIRSLVKVEDMSPCSEFSSDLLFEVTYYKKRINLEVKHVLTDGTGALSFLKSLIRNYFDLLLGNKLITKELSTTEQERDGFNRHYDPDSKLVSTKSKIAYQLSGKLYSENRLQIIECIVSTKEFIKLAKSYNTTVTILVTSLLIKSIESNMDFKDKKRDIVITVPVNLRSYYSFETMRNFFNVVNISYRPSNSSLEEIINCVKLEFSNSLNEDSIKSSMNKLISFERFFLIRAIPLFIKDLILGLVYKVSNLFRTSTVSNVGIVKDLDEFNEIDYFSVFTSTERNQLCTVSYLDKFCMSFSSHFISRDIEKCFVDNLVNLGLDVVVNSNSLGDYE